MSDAGGIEVRGGNQPAKHVEFPYEDWLNAAAVLYLPTAGFRVHVITGPERESRF
jgi:hypothetical protein